MESVKKRFVQITLNDPRCWVVSELVEETDYETILKDPLLYCPDMLLRFCPGTKENLVSVQKEHIMAIGSPSEDTIKMHLENLQGFQEAESARDEREPTFPTSSALH